MHTRLLFLHLCLQSSIFFAAEHIVTAQALKLMNMEKTHFMWLPDECLNHIASFLPFDDRETDEEFVQRTSLLKEIKDVDKQLFNEINGNNIRWIEYSYASERDTIFCAGKKFDAPPYFIRSCNLREGAIVKEQPACFEFQPYDERMRCFAISRDEKQCAYVMRIKTPDPDDDRCDDYPFSYDYELRVYNVASTPNKPIKLGIFAQGSFSLAFNKQGTKLIIYLDKALDFNTYHGLQKDFEGCHYSISAITSEAEHAQKSAKTFLTYLTQLQERYKNSKDQQ